jgi:hypothetical protein
MKHVGQNISVPGYSGGSLEDHRTAQTIERVMQNIMDDDGEAGRTPDNSILEEAKTRLLRSLILIIPFTSYEM